MNRSSQSKILAISLGIGLISAACRTPAPVSESKAVALTRIGTLDSEPSFVKSLPNAGGQILTSTWTGAVTLWSLSQRKTLWTKNYSEKIHHLETSRSGRLIYVGGDNGLVRLIEAATGKELSRLDQPSLGSAVRLAVSDDGRRLAAVFLNQQLVIFDLERSRIDFSIDNIFEWPAIKALQFSSDAQRLLIADLGGASEIDLLKKTVVRKFKDHRYCTQARCIPWLSAATISDDRRLLAVGSMNEVRLFETETGKELFTLGGHIGDVDSIKISTGNQEIRSVGIDGSVMAWTIPSFELKVMHTESPREIWQALATDDLKFLVGISRINFDIVLSNIRNISATYNRQKEQWQGQVRLDSNTKSSIRYGLGQFSERDISCTKNLTQECSPSHYCFNCAGGETFFIDTTTGLGNITLKVQAEDGQQAEVIMRCTKHNDNPVTAPLYNCLESSQI